MDIFINAAVPSHRSHKENLRRMHRLYNRGRILIYLHTCIIHVKFLSVRIAFETFAWVAVYSTFAWVTAYSTLAKVAAYHTFAQVAAFSTFAWVAA